MRMRRRWAQSFFFNDTATTEIYTLSLHDALPIYLAQQVLGLLRAQRRMGLGPPVDLGQEAHVLADGPPRQDRKSTRLNSSHANISHAVFCLKILNGRSSLVNLVVYLQLRSAITQS